MTDIMPGVAVLQTGISQAKDDHKQLRSADPPDRFK